MSIKSYRSRIDRRSHHHFVREHRNMFKIYAGEIRDGEFYHNLRSYQKKAVEHLKGRVLLRITDPRTGKTIDGGFIGKPGRRPSSLCPTPIVLKETAPITIGSYKSVVGSPQ